MSKMMKIMIALAAIALLAGPAFAEDRLGLGGEMRVRGWFQDDGTNNSAFADQRLRIGGKISIAEGVSVTFRFDETERQWGNGGNENGSGRMAADGMQWDRAHLDITKGAFHLRAGQQWVGYGLLGGTVNAQEAGLSADINAGAVKISAFWLLDDSRIATATTDNNNDGKIDSKDVTGFYDTTADSNLFGVNVAHKTDAYSANVFLANQTKANDARENVYLLGANVVAKLGAVNLAGEIDIFTGDATETKDAKGAQLLIDASIAPSDAATVGGQILYAMSVDGNEVQYEYLGNDFGGWDPVMDVGTNLSNEEIKLGRPYDFTGDGAGLIGVRVYGKVKASDAVNIGASIGYLLPEDDGITDVNSAIALAAGVTYQVMSNTSLHAQLQWSDADVDGNDPDAVTQAGVGLFVNF